MSDLESVLDAYREEGIHSQHNACMFREKCRSQAARIKELESSLAAAVAEREAAERDAGRYRWFRNKLRDYDGDVALWEHTKGCDYDIKQGANLDAAIDAARKEQP